MIRLLYFAILREKLGKQEEMLEFSGSVGELRKLLIKREPHLADVLKVCLFAVNQEYVGEDFVLKGGKQLR
jgi:molybdopterin synthase sulfur carrier subunit